jgi:hypothetical protein
VNKPSLISTMTDAGIAHYGGGKNPRDIIRAAKNNAPIGSVFRRELEAVLKQDTPYLEKAFGYIVTRA